LPKTVAVYSGDPVDQTASDRTQQRRARSDSTAHQTALPTQLGGEHRQQ